MTIFSLFIPLFINWDNVSLFHPDSNHVLYIKSSGLQTDSPHSSSMQIMIISWAWMESRLLMILRKLPFKNLFLVKIVCRDGRLPPLQIGEHYSEKKE